MRPEKKPRYAPAYKSMPVEPVGTLWLPDGRRIKGFQDENAEIVPRADGDGQFLIVKVN